MKYLLIAVGFILSFPLFAQKVIMVRGYTKNTAYMGIDNPLTLLAEGNPRSSLSLTSDNGSITKLGDGRFNYRPSALGTSKLTVYMKKDDEFEKIDSLIWQVEPLPLPVPSIGGFQNLSVVSKEAFRAQAGLRASGPSVLGFEISFTVTRFDIIIIKEDSVIFYNQSLGNLFTSKMREEFKRLDTGSRIIFSSIYAVGADNKEMKLTPLEYEIK